MTPEEIQQEAFNHFPPVDIKQLQDLISKKQIIDGNDLCRTGFIKGLSEKEKYAELKVDEYKRELVKKVNQLWENSSEKSSSNEVAVGKFHLKIIELITPKDDK